MCEKYKGNIENERIRRETSRIKTELEKNIKNERRDEECKRKIKNIWRKPSRECISFSLTPLDRKVYYTPTSWISFRSCTVWRLIPQAAIIKNNMNSRTSVVVSWSNQLMNKSIQVTLKMFSRWTMIFLVSIGIANIKKKWNKCTDLGRLPENYKFWQINKIILKYDQI